MADSHPRSCEMEEGSHRTAIELWEESYANYEHYLTSKKFRPGTQLYDLTCKIRGTFILIVNYFQTFPEFGNSPEAMDLTCNALDDLDTIREENIGDEVYFPALLTGLKIITMEINTACFVIGDYEHENVGNVPAKRKRVESKPARAQTKKTVSPAVPTQNKFQVLANLDETDGATASTSPNVPIIPSDSMDTTDPTEATVNGATERTSPKKEPRPPPITILGHDNLFQISKELKKIIKNELKVVNTQEGLRYYTSTAEDHRLLTEFFKHHNRQYYTFQLRSDMPLRVMLKRLP